jgi:hypothetical protein
MVGLEQGSSSFTDLPWETVSLSGLAVSFGPLPGIYETQGERRSGKRPFHWRPFFLTLVSRHEPISSPTSSLCTDRNKRGLEGKVPACRSDGLR